MQNPEGAGRGASVPVAPEQLAVVQDPLGRSASRPHRALVSDLFARRREQILYLLFGGWNTVFGYGVWALFQFTLGDRLPYLAIVILSWPIAVLNAYVVYRVFVFRSHGRILAELPRFSLVYFLTLIVNLALLPIALRVLPFNIYGVQATFLAVVVVASYLGHRYFSFGGSRRGTIGGAQLRPNGGSEGD